jgi:hypothetical protein
MRFDDIDLSLGLHERTHGAVPGAFAMSDYDRYPPNQESPLAFDARRPVRGEGPVPMTLIISGMVLLVLVAAVFFVYRGGLSAKDGAPRPVGTAVNDIKAPPPADAQPVNKAADLTIYKAEAGTPPPANVPDAVALAPPPEAPLQRPAPRAVTEATPAQVAPSQAAAVRPAAPVSAPLKPAQTAAAPPAASPVKAPVLAATAVAKPASKPLIGGGASVQIGAFGSAAAADKGWSAAAAVAPGAALGKGKHVETVAGPNGAVLYRTLITGFASRQEAEAFCVTLKGAGKSCIVK